MSAYNTYFVISPTSSWPGTPTAAQIVAGKLSDNNDAPFIGNHLSPTISGVETLDSVFGLTGDTSYTIALVGFNGIFYTNVVVGSGTTLTALYTDYITTNWTASTGTNLGDMIDETVYDDGDYIISPNISIAPTPCIFLLGAPLSAGSKTIKIRARYVGIAGQFRVRILNNSDVDIGGSDWQTPTTTFGLISSNITISETGYKIKIEIQLV